MQWVKGLSVRLGSRRRSLDESTAEAPKISRRRLLSRSRQSSPSLISTTSGESFDKNRHHGKEAAKDAKWKIENILVNGPPSEAEWWGEDSSGPALEGDDSMDWSSGDDDSSRRFYNCGRASWEKARSAWRQPTVVARVPSPPPVRYEEVVRGLTSASRQCDLPGRMKLRDIVSVYNDLWDADSDPW